MSAPKRRNFCAGWNLWKGQGAFLPTEVVCLNRRAATCLQIGEEFAPRLRPESEEMRTRLLSVVRPTTLNRIVTRLLEDFAHVDAVGLSRVQSEDLGAQPGGHLRIAIPNLKFLRNLEGAERLDLILGQISPDPLFDGTAFIELLAVRTETSRYLEYASSLARSLAARGTVTRWSANSSDWPSG